MDTVEAHAEDKAFDMMSYIDKEGNSYDFDYGLNWNGIIGDERIKIYNKY